MTHLFADSLHHRLTTTKPSHIGMSRRVLVLECRKEREKSSHVLQAQGAKCPCRLCRFAVVRQNRFRDAEGAAIVQKATTRAKPPKGCRTPITTPGATLNDSIVEGRPHVVEQKNRIELDLPTGGPEGRCVARGAAKD